VCHSTALWNGSTPADLAGTPQPRGLVACPRANNQKSTIVGYEVRGRITGRVRDIIEFMVRVGLGSFPCVISPLPFISYTTPLGTVESISSPNHHLYANDT
jgi:hypothetical protein